MENDKSMEEVFEVDDDDNVVTTEVAKTSPLLKLLGFGNIPKDGNITKEIAFLRREVSELRLANKILQERNAYLVKKNSILLEYCFENNL
tara:strand:+ start:222 stop:491 length:270 start_codon:yes stop_codon:yes gene_type:complete